MLKRILPKSMHHWGECRAQSPRVDLSCLGLEHALGRCWVGDLALELDVVMTARAIDGQGIKQVVGALQSSSFAGGSPKCTLFQINGQSPSAEDQVIHHISDSDQKQWYKPHKYVWPKNKLPSWTKHQLSRLRSGSPIWYSSERRGGWPTSSLRAEETVLQGVPQCR